MASRAPTRLHATLVARRPPSLGPGSVKGHDSFARTSLSEGPLTHRPGSEDSPPCNEQLRIA